MLDNFVSISVISLVFPFSHFLFFVSFVYIIPKKKEKKKEEEREMVAIYSEIN